MLENLNDSPDPKIQQTKEICEQICEFLDGIRNPDIIAKEGTLDPKLKKLITLGLALASQLGRDVVASCVVDCLSAHATCDEVEEVLRQAILIAEIPARNYTKIINEAIDAFENQH